MRILWISQASFANTVSVTDRIEVPRYLQQFGHRVRMIVASDQSRVEQPDWCEEVWYVGVPHKRGRQLPSFLWQLTRLLPSALSRFLPDVVVCDYSSVPGVLPLAKSSAHRNIPFVLDVRTCPTNLRGLGGVWRQSQYQLGIRLAHRYFQGITVITPRLRREISDQFGIDPARIGQWSSGASVDLFDPARVKAVSRAQFGLQDRFVVMYHGVFRPDRGIEETILAVSKLAGAGYPIGLFILGDGPLSARLAEAVRNESAESYITIHEAVAYRNVPSYVALSDIGVNVPNPRVAWWQPQSFLKVMEYLSMERPVILSDIEAHRDVAPSTCAEYVSDNAPGTIASAILKLYRQRDDLARRGKIGRQVVLERFTWASQAHKMEDYLLGVVRHPQQ